MNKHCKQQLEKFGMEVEDVTHVCIAPTLYPLLQYLLLMDDDIAFRHTFYFVNELIPENVRSHLPCQYLNYFGKEAIHKMYRRVAKLKLRFFKYIDFPFLKTAEIFAYDLPYGSLCIGNRNYNLLPDAPNCLTLNSQYDSAEYIRMQNHANSWVGRLQRMVFGDLFVHYLGHNSQCRAVFMTEENTTPIIEGKAVHVRSLPSMWSDASEEKKRFIMGLFDITNDDITLLNSRPNLFFSQPLVNDCGLTETEYTDILVKIFKNYPTGSVIIKTHPRDKFAYSKHFPDILVFSKPISSQLLYIIGVTPQKIITISSTAIEGFPESIACDYYGIFVHPKIKLYFGDNYKPLRSVNYKYDHVIP